MWEAAALMTQEASFRPHEKSRRKRTQNSSRLATQADKGQKLQNGIHTSVSECGGNTEEEWVQTTKHEIMALLQVESTIRQAVQEV